MARFSFHMVLVFQFKVSLVTTKDIMGLHFLVLTVREPLRIC